MRSKSNKRCRNINGQPFVVEPSTNNENLGSICMSGLLGQQLAGTHSVTINGPHFPAKESTANEKSVSINDSAPMCGLPGPEHCASAQIDTHCSRVARAFATEGLHLLYSTIFLPLQALHFLWRQKIQHYQYRKTKIKEIVSLYVQLFNFLMCICRESENSRTFHTSAAY